MGSAFHLRRARHPPTPTPPLLSVSPAHHHVQGAPTFHIVHHVPTPMSYTISTAIHRVLPALTRMQTLACPVLRHVVPALPLLRLA